ncbi:MAG TPA: tetratricopeptide repeat protein, partial [Armatimonadota bacterium]|nr:tetratricopeptide repeat protein [Armatimonadota bacterium]
MGKKAKTEKRSPGRLPLLLVVLLLLIVAYFASAHFRRNALIQADLTRRQVQSAEKAAREELELRAKRQERAKLLARLADDPENVDLLLQTAALYGQDRQYEDAVFLLQEALRIDPARIETYRALHEVYLSQGQYDRAYDCATEGLKRSPGDLELSLGLVHVDSLVGWNTAARETLRALQNSPNWNNPRVRAASALIHRQVTDSREAETDLKAAVEKEPANSTLWALLSGVQWEIGKGPEAETSIRKALQLDPDNPDYLLHLAELQLRKRTPADIEASRQTAEAALKADPGNRNAFFAIAQALVAQQKTAQAQEILEQLIRRYPDHALAGLEL